VAGPATLGTTPWQAGKKVCVLIKINSVTEDDTVIYFVGKLESRPIFRLTKDNITGTLNKEV
jgi:hypothetical protein